MLYSHIDVTSSYPAAIGGVLLTTPKTNPFNLASGSDHELPVRS